MTARPPPDSSTPLSPTPVRPDPTALQRPHGDEETAPAPRRKRNHRGGKKKRNRRQSFAAPSDDGSGLPEISQDRVQTESATRASFYRLHGHNASNTSIDSEALLDHRDQEYMKPRRSSIMGQMYSSPAMYRNPFVSQDSFKPQSIRPKTARSGTNSHGEEEEEDVDERAPLISTSARSKSSGAAVGYGPYSSTVNNNQGQRPHRESSRSSKSSRRRTIFDKPSAPFPSQTDYNVNYPPSVPGSPEPGESRRDLSFRDMIARNDFNSGRASPRANLADEYAIDIETRSSEDRVSISESPRRPTGFDDRRRHTIALQAEEDVCFPTEGMSDLAEDDLLQRSNGEYRQEGGAPRRRRHVWPDLTVLDDWSRLEKEGRSEERRSKKIIEPELVAGRLRPTHRGWHRAEDDAPYRFTYFNEEFQSTLHSQTISELIQPGQSFRELFIPDPPVLSDSESDEEGEIVRQETSFLHHPFGFNGESRASTRQGSLIDPMRREPKLAGSASGDRKQDPMEASEEQTPSGLKSPEATKPPKRFGDRPTWWLDVLSPTDAEMKVISKTFGIHPLTAEDIMMQEAREKVELFRNYYFVNYRTFEQDMNSEDFLEPVNMYVVVFREGIISFHFSMTPHPANVRRRIRQLKDYLILSSDWISYAIIDDITDVFAPLIQNIEDEVDDIDDAILKQHSPGDDEKDPHKSNKENEKKSENGDVTSAESGGDMLRRVGDCRKKVMGLYRLLGNKADVIKGFAKRCNEQWEVAPRSEIGLYLGDIQDHIVTMTGNLSHYEKILARAHGNYLAQINIRMNERQEQTADVLGKLTVLGTIVLPMNIITGLWGMNVWVPGQEHEGNLAWFWCITAGLLVFGLACFFIAKTLYRIV